MPEFLVDVRRVQFASVRVEAENEDAALEKVREGYDGSGIDSDPAFSFFWEDDSFEAFEAELDNG